MTLYKVTATVTEEVTFEVEADNPIEAEDNAKDLLELGDIEDYEVEDREVSYISAVEVD